MRRWLFIGLGILISLEGVVRLTCKDAWELPFSAAAVPGVFSFRFKPGTEVAVTVADTGSFHFTTNARGFRGPLVSSLPPHPLRIVSLGDSFTFAWGLELGQHAMSLFVDDYRRVRPGRPVENVFVSQPGWDPKDYFLAYLAEVLPTAVDVVVVGFFAGNDLMPEKAGRYRGLADAAFNPYVPRPLARSELQWKTLAQLKTWVASHPSLIDSALALGSQPVELKRFERDLPAAEEDRLWSSSLYYLDALNQAVRRHGARLVILSYPSEIQLPGGPRLSNRRYDWERPDRMLSRFSESRGIDFIPLLPALSTEGGMSLYWPRDRHINAQGHEVCARELKNRLTPILDREWLKRTRPRVVAE